MHSGTPYHSRQAGGGRQFTEGACEAQPWEHGGRLTTELMIATTFISRLTKE